MSDFQVGVRLMEDMQSDAELLAEYAERRSETAFSLLVGRYVALVHTAAYRQVGDVHLAQEITQAVFIILARKAGSLGSKTVLSGWLCRTAHFAARDALKVERRRRQRELIAVMNPSESESQAAWQQLSTLLDEAVAKLGETDRNAVVMRFYEQRSLEEVGTALGVGADAAQKRVARALEKLRKLFAKRGVVLTAALIAGTISANSVQAVPADLTARISLSAGKGLATTKSIAALVKGTMKSMSWNNNVITAVAVCGAIILAAGTTTLLAQHSDKAGAQIPYKVLDDACRLQDSVNQTNLVLRIIIVSNNKTVRPSDIHLTIQSARRGNIAVKLGSKGQILDFPDDEGLRRENPPVVSNQPKGSLHCNFWVYVPKPEGFTFPYSHLVNAVEEANRAMDRANQEIKSDYARRVSPFSGDVSGVGLVFGPSSARKAKIVIQTAAGRKDYVADAHGVIRLKINPELQAENPMITVSEKPEWIAVLRM
jgi:RNA polymerase sigma factor (sigma-70 family)